MLYDSYLEQVKAALWGQAVSDASFTERDIQMHMMQGTGTLVFPHRTSMTPQMKMVCLQNMQQQVKLQYTLSQAWTSLTKAGITPVLMKGAGLAALYLEPQMRTWGDIDLFVGTDQYHPACAVMRETFPDALKFDEELDHYKHYNIIADGISIETHRVSVSLPHPLDARRYAKMEQYGMTHAVPLTIGSSSLTLMVPEPTFNALFVMLHSWEHMMSMGANIRQLCDFTLLVHHYAGQIDAKRLKRYLSDVCLTDVWQLYITIAVQYLGLPQEEALLYKADRQVAARAEGLLNDLLSGKMVAPKATGPAPKGRLARKWHTMQERMANARRMKAYSPAYGRHMATSIWISGLLRLFAKDRHWE